MSKINAKIIADSVIYPFGGDKLKHRITTMMITFPRFILAELNTHRITSRNSASSRAIPFKKMLKSVTEDPFIPIAFQKEHSGMQGTEYFTGFRAKLARFLWISASKVSIIMAKLLNKNKVTKQLCNRLLEPFMWHTVLITATEWENFFNLRCPRYELFSENMPMTFKSKKDLLKYVKSVEADEFKNVYDDLTDLEWLQCNSGQAEIHMMALAEAMYDALNESTPKKLQAGEWHLPFSDDLNDDKVYEECLKPFNIEYNQDRIDEIKRSICVARCARTSYTVVGIEGSKKPTLLDDLRVYEKFEKADPKHSSPFEHIAKAMGNAEFLYFIKGDTFKKALNKEYGWCNNFQGWIQLRYLIDQKNK